MRGTNQDGRRMKFEIVPRRRRDGFTLNSKSLIFPIWYTTLNGAISYARFLGRENGCDIRVCNASGSLVEEINIDGNFLQTGVGPKRGGTFERKDASILDESA